MQLSQSFVDNPINFEKRCRSRMITGILSALLGATALGMMFISKSRVFISYLEPGYREYIPGSYRGIGVGLMAVGIITVTRNTRHLKGPEFRKARKIYETDEKNRLLGPCCWAYTGYTMMTLFHIGILVSGFTSLAVSRTLMTAITCYGVILVIFRQTLQKAV